MCKKKCRKCRTAANFINWHQLCNDTLALPVLLWGSSHVYDGLQPHGHLSVQEWKNIAEHT